MNKVWMLSDRKDEGILPDIGLGNLAMEATSLAPGGVSCSHSHDLIEEICLFKAGTGRIQIEEQHFDVSPDSVAIINAGEFHEISNIGAEYLDYVSFFNTNVDLTSVRLKTREQHFADYDMPSYAGLLGKIVVGETRGTAAFKRWSENTADAALSKALGIITLRKAEHAATFEKRLNELGCPVEGDLGDAFEATMQVCESDASDLEKLKCFSADHDVFDTIFADKTIDAQTAGLLGRFIAEERDSIRMLERCHQTLSDHSEALAQPAQEADSAIDPDIHAIGDALTSLIGIVDALKVEINELKAANKAYDGPGKRAHAVLEKKSDL